MRARTWFTISVAAALSAAVWGLSPWLVDHREPWDADGQFYAVALATTGFIAGLLTPRPVWAHYLGSVLGQVTYEVLFLPIGPLFIVGLAFMLAYSLIFLAAAVLAAFGRARLLSRPPRG
jgi:hypothetical protein